MKKVLVIDSEDQGSFCLLVSEGALTIGDGPVAEAQVTLSDLHILSIHCEVEVEEDVVQLSAKASNSQAGKKPMVQELHPGEEFHIGNAHLRLLSAAKDDGAKTPLVEKPQGKAARTPLPKPQADSGPMLIGGGSFLSKQLLVIDGADQKQRFRLPVTGSMTIGNTGRNADIGLHDFYVSGVHCILEIRDEKVFVTPNEGKNGTLINGQRITQQQELNLGDVLRVGNSHLRLDAAGEEGRLNDSPSTKKGPTSPSPVKWGTGTVSMAPTETKLPPRKGETPVPTMKDSAKAPEEQVVGNYRIGNLLGSGHSGRVFLAQDMRSNQFVALKILAPEFPANSTELQQFAQSLKAATLLPHANLITLFGAGKNGPHCWIAREYIEGECVAGMVRRLKEEGKLTWTRALRVATHLGRALAFLHEQKAVHGNITPKNVLIGTEDKATKLTDLMLSKALNGSRLHQILLEKKQLSELAYLAPEQIDPNAFVDHLADLYAVGAVVYTLLTGEPPFSGSTPEKVMTRIREAPVVRPTRYQPKTPFAFEGVVLKLLAKRQEDRYQTANELLADLEFLAQENQVKV